jgi:hypothetical protein
MRKLLLCWCLLLCSFAVQAETEFKIITLQHRFASDLIPVVEPMIGPDGTINSVDNQLILRANPERMREIEALVSKLDTAKANRKITIRTGNTLQSEQTRVETRGAVKVGKVTVANDRHAKPDSGRVEVNQHSRDTQQSSQQFINVLDGERAFIRVGKIVPFTQEWVTLTRRYVHIERFTDWREVSTGFAVRPRAVSGAQSNQIELEITPRIASLDGRGFIDIEELTTVVRTTLGTWVDLGGTMQKNDEVSRKILGFSETSNNRTSTLQMRAD